MELAEQKKLNATTLSKADGMVHEAQAKVKSECEQLLMKQSQDFADKEQNLLQTIKELRLALTRANDKAAWKEDQLNNEIQVGIFLHSVKVPPRH